MKSKGTYIINRSGALRTSAVTENQCKDRGHTEYMYEARVRVGGRLDKNGFVIDHADIHKAVERAFTKMGSCEQLAMASAKQIAKACRRHGCDLKSVYVKVQPVGRDVRAFMEIELDF